MKQETYNDEAIKRYLLGALPEAEAEALDELSFTDDRFADALLAKEKHLVDAFVNGELSGTELERFKSYYLVTPLRREKVKLAQAIHHFAEANSVVHVAGVDVQQAAKRNGSSWFPPSGTFTVPRLAIQWGAAFAVLVTLIVGGWFAFENTGLRQQISQTPAVQDAPTQAEQRLQKGVEGQRDATSNTKQELAPAREERERLPQEPEHQKVQAQQQTSERPSGLEQSRSQRQPRPASPGGVNLATFILTPQLRTSAEQLPTVSIPARTAQVAMRLQLDPNDYKAYRVALFDQSGAQIVWRSNNLRASIAGDDKILNIRFPAGLLKRQKYMLRVSGISANTASEIVGDYPFLVVK